MAATEVKSAPAEGSTIHETSELSAATTNANGLEMTTEMTSSAASEAGGVIIVRSDVERVLFELYLNCSMITSILLNLLVLFAIKNNARLVHKPESVIIGVDAINNIAQVLVTEPIMVWALSVDHPLPPSVLCHVQGTLAVSHLSLTAHILCVYAVERWCFLCSPIEYSRRITRRRLIIALTCLYLLSLIVNSLAAYKGRMFTTTMLSCQSRTPATSTLILMILYACPGVLIVLYVVRKIKALDSRTITVHAAPVAAAGSDQRDSRERMTRRRISTTKTLLFVSGSCFLTLLPAALLRLIVLYVGVSPLDLETRNCNPAWPILFRIANLVMMTTVSFLNPIFYMSTRNNLKESLRLPNCVASIFTRRIQVQSRLELACIATSQRPGLRDRQMDT